MNMFINRTNFVSGRSCWQVYGWGVSSGCSCEAGRCFNCCRGLLRHTWPNSVRLQRNKNPHPGTLHPVSWDVTSVGLEIRRLAMKVNVSASYLWLEIDILLVPFLGEWLLIVLNMLHLTIFSRIRNRYSIFHHNQTIPKTIILFTVTFRSAWQGAFFMQGRLRTLEG